MSDNNGNNQRRPGGAGSPIPRPRMTPWILVLLAITALLAFNMLSSAAGRKDISYTEFQNAVNNGQIDPNTTLKISDTSISGTISANGTSQDFTTKLPANFQIDQAYTDWLAAHKVSYTFETPSAWVGLLYSVLPIVLLLGISYWFLFRRVGGAGANPLNMGKNKVKIYDRKEMKTTFSDVAGVDEAKEELKEIVEFLRNPKKYQRLGGRIPKGVLLLGPPGCGKTLLARAVAGEAGVPFFSMSGSEFVEMIVGVGAARVRDLFKQARENAPAIIFVDELDAIGRARGLVAIGGSSEQEQTLNQILTEMDGFSSREGIIVLAATNQPEVLDKALLRPGRFDRRVVVNLPDKVGREAILKVHTRHVPLASDAILPDLAAVTPGLTGADLKNLVNEAALLAARRFAAPRVA